MAGRNLLTRFGVQVLKVGLCNGLRAMLPRYLVDHLRRAAERAGIAPRLLLATPVPEEEGAVAAHGLTPEGEAWLREMRG